MSPVAKDQRKEIVIEQLSQRHIGKARNNDGAEELQFPMAPS